MHLDRVRQGALVEWSRRLTVAQLATYDRIGEKKATNIHEYKNLERKIEISSGNETKSRLYAKKEEIEKQITKITVTDRNLSRNQKTFSLNFYNFHVWEYI